ncbi:MYOM2 [Cervus elaphus hippelaphus]|uniref:MYOM2 n=1 Tax=Cervus elaphus hippelaphus TaxID=46360 RepID=A0A212C2Y8_CEREH|nr:MYOM2 [Cervus elaphus hippelaphus]
MSLVAVPFYQKRHKHFDQSYRNIQTRYLLDEYAAKKKYQSMLAAYGEAKRERYLSELAQLEEDVHVARTHARDQLDRLALQHAGRHGLHHAVDDRLAWERHSFEDRISRAPEILVRLRSHTVWERMSVKLCFTVQGFPTPVVQWYKDGSLICQAGEPGKYRIDSKYGVHTLEINRLRTYCVPHTVRGLGIKPPEAGFLTWRSSTRRADFDDTATYSAVATNVHGQVSTNAAVVVRRFRGDEEPFHSVGLPIGLPLSSVIPYTHFDVQFIEKFGVTFRREGETLTLKCTLLVTPDLKRVHPRAEWYRDAVHLEGEKDIVIYQEDLEDVLLKESKWTKMFFGEGQASLSFSHLNKDDEGLYTLRIVSRGGITDHSAFLFVRGEVQIPGPPTNVHASETSRTYVVLSWDPPEPRGKEPLMYFIEKSMVGSGSWQRVNAQMAVRSPRYAVFDLAEGKPYVFRVLSANKHGLSDPSEITAPIQAQDTIGSWCMASPLVPKFSGGSPIIGYYVDKREAHHKNWHEVNSSPLKERILTNLDKEDLGTYSVSVSDTDGVSSSFVMDEEAIPLKSELAYEIFDKGQVRFWLQAEHLSPDSSYRFIINDREVSDSEAHRIKCDKSTGIIEMVMDRFTIDNEGTYTVQIQDGKAKSQSSLVLIGDGPHFAEYLHWDVTDECEVRLVCKVGMLTIKTIETPTMPTAVDQGLPPAPWGLPSDPSPQACLQHTHQSFSVRGYHFGDE